ncbi:MULTISPECIES: hypothetical protein [Nocardia]|uniref:Low molecular weight antigen MTB12-like C-terminal domain-containing protein n=1 Tax=Nocardia coubleae TaxID=356147 RepID=A0A846WA35_9NOCA|nr:MULTISPECIES: hypothetical protein [Nocardia]MCA2208413.1 hypothetical protein [Nocardia rosealba]NKX89683.1 hypothetical protein [Nocardia coubleae]
MKLRRTGRVAIAGLAVVAALGMSACSDDKGDKPAAKSTTSAPATTTAAAADLPPVPTVEELNAQLNTALDPSVPNEQKLDFVQGGEADPELPNRLAVAARDAGAQVQVTEVTSFGDSVNAKANFTVNGQTNVVDVPFVAEDGKWKVQKSWACTMLTNLGQQSVACA